MNPSPFYLLLVGLFLAATGPFPVNQAWCEEAEEVPAGHSYHGEAFNEGPRQAAELIPGMAKIQFATSTRSKKAQAFFEQGIAQLHGFWYLEAERSFRQAAKEDPDLAIAYWGMAMANHNNDERARGFIDEAKTNMGKATSERERLYIESLDRFLPQKSSSSDEDEESKPDAKAKEKLREAKKKRTERYLSDIEKILHQFPDDVEAKAILVVQLWLGDRNGVKLASRYAVSALQNEIFMANPMHPAHHYRIHLWDSARPDNALQSAAKCGPASPGIAHMWHMPGHIYSKLKRYHDAAWQQEASARVDHAHMIRTRLLPDQIHNFAHNNEWLVRNLIFLGRVNDAVDLAKNLISLPRHPRYNTLKKGGSYKYGRQRLVLVLSQFGLWESLLEEFETGVLKLKEDAADYETLLSWKGVAQFMSGQRSDGAATLRMLQRSRVNMEEEWLDLTEEDQSDETAKKTKELKKRREVLRELISRVAAAAAVARKDQKAFERRVEAAKLNATMQAQWMDLAGNRGEAIRIAQKAVKDGASEVRPLAVLVDLLWRDGKREQAFRKFQQLRRLAAEADLQTPVLSCLQPVANAAEIKGDWRLQRKQARDIGERPPLDQLGPFRWNPYDAPIWKVKNSFGKTVSSDQMAAGPKLVVLYLGFGCLHCIEQLHEISPRVNEFKALGIDVVGISNESLEDLTLGVESFDKEMNVPLFTDDLGGNSSSTVFKQFRCWDDFEDQPLHGTFLIDSDGKVRWQDISYEPFTDVDFLLEEFERLLSM